MRLVIALLFIVLMVGCKDATISQFEALGSKHKVTMYGCDGRIIGQWESTGNISNQENSGGWYFKDVKTGKLVEVTGQILIEQE
jgi:hypothetical protein